MTHIPFQRLQHLITVAVAVGGVESQFVLDTGIGLTLVSKTLYAAAGCRTTGAFFSGRRMSGQEVTLPLATAGSVVFGSLAREHVGVGVLDMSSFPPELAEIGGFLSLAFLEGSPFTIDSPGRVVVLESAESLVVRRDAGVPVSVSVERDGPSVTMMCPLTIPGGRSISVEVDTGSDSLILDERLSDEVGVGLDNETAPRVEGVDETGQTYTRFFGRIEGSIHPTGAPELAQEAPEVMFQRIIYDGLLGDSFLGRFVVTYDVAAAEMIFERAAASA